MLTHIRLKGSAGTHIFGWPSGRQEDGYSWFMADQSEIESLRHRIRMLQVRERRILAALDVEGNTPDYRAKLRLDLVKITSQIFDLKAELSLKTEGL